jgi:hypothetical protein
MAKAFASSIGMSSGTIKVNVLTRFPTNDQDFSQLEQKEQTNFSQYI